MNVFVIGRTHLAKVTAVCLAPFNDVTQWDEPTYDTKLTEWDPGENAITLGNPTDAQRADVIWLAIDTPVVGDTADVENVLKRAHLPLVHAKPGTIVIVSSQLPVGTTKRLAEKYTLLRFVSNPENIRVGRGIQGFRQPDRVVLGIEDVTLREPLERLFKPFTSNLLFMSWASAELVKHMLNAHLAMQIAFANEMGLFCLDKGASPSDVARGLKSDSRIGHAAYLDSGPPPGPNLMREINFLDKAAGGLFSSIKRSHEEHERDTRAAFKKAVGA